MTSILSNLHSKNGVGAGLPWHPFTPLRWHNAWSTECKRKLSDARQKVCISAFPVDRAHLALKPKSDIGVQSDFVMLPCRLVSASVEGLADYAATKRQTRCRQQDERAWKAIERYLYTRRAV